MATSPPSTARNRRSLGDLRYLAVVAVLGLAVTSIATFGIAVGKTVTLVHDTIDHGWNDDLIIVTVLKAVDTYLLAVVQLIVAIGMFELFIADLHLPDWLEARSLDDLKKPIIDVLIVFVTIKGIERYLETSQPLDALAAVGAAAALITALTAYRLLTTRGHHHPPPRTDRPS